MAKPAISNLFPDWSLLPEELLHLISKNLENCFDIVHTRSVCSSWRSSLPFPCCLLRPSYSLPSFADFPFESKGFVTLEKAPLFLFRVRAPTPTCAAEYFVGGISQDESKDRMELSSPLQCSVKVEIARSEPTLMNMLDCQILPLGYRYRFISSDHSYWSTNCEGVAFLQLNNKEGGEGGEFVVLVNYNRNLLMLTSSNMRWKRLKKPSEASSCSKLVAFRGRFYAEVLGGGFVAIDPYSLEGNHLIPPSPPLKSLKYLVPSGDDELFLAELIIPFSNRLACRVSKLDEEFGKWVEVSDLGDHVLFITEMGYCSLSAEELPDSCGVSGNSIVFTDGPGNLTYVSKYGLPTDNAGENFNLWRYFTEYAVTILNRSSPLVVALRVQS